MKNKRILIFIIVILALVVLYFGYKTFLLMKYNYNSLTDYSIGEIKYSLRYKDTMTINKTDLKKNEEYLEFENMKIRNDFKDYEELELGDTNIGTYKSYKLVKKDDKGNALSAIFLGTDIPYYELLSNPSDYYEEEFDNDYFKILIKENNIKSDMEFIEYAKDIKKVNIFSSIESIKENYSKVFFLTLMIPDVTYLTKIEGDYSGYMINTPNGIKEVNIELNGKKYYITFIDKNDKFTFDYINEILNTLVIE